MQSLTSNLLDRLRMEIVRAQSQNESSTIKIKVSKGAKKDVFKDDICKQH